MEKINTFICYRPLKICFQIALLTAIYLACHYLAAIIAFPIPPGLIGMGVLFLLLATGLVELSWVEDGGDWLLSTMALFFVPSAVGIMKYASLARNGGIQIALAIIVGTISVMAVSGLMTEWAGRIITYCKSSLRVGDSSDVSIADTNRV